MITTRRHRLPRHDPPRQTRQTQLIAPLRIRRAREIFLPLPEPERWAQSGRVSPTDRLALGAVPLVGVELFEAVEHGDPPGVLGREVRGCHFGVVVGAAIQFPGFSRREGGGVGEGDGEDEDEEAGCEIHLDPLEKLVVLD